MGVSELGAFLQRHREERGWTLDEVEALTRIRRRYLEALESGDWDHLPPSVYTRGLVRNYARALGVSQAGAMRMFVKERPHEARLPEPQLISQPLVSAPRFNLELAVAGVLLVVSAVLVVWAVQSAVPGLGRRAAGGTPGFAGEGTLVAAAGVRTLTPTGAPDDRPTRTLMPTIEGRRSAPAVREPADTAAAPVSSTLASDPEALSPSSPRRTSTAMTPTPRATPTARATATPTGPLALEIAVTADAWLEVRADGQVVFRDFLRQGESRRWVATERIGLRTGNAGGTDVKLNGQAPPAPLGERGAVKEFEWRLLPNGEIEQREL